MQAAATAAQGEDVNWTRLEQRMEEMLAQQDGEPGHGSAARTEDIAGEAADVATSAA